MSAANVATIETRELHMFTDDEDWVIAESAEEARDLYCAAMGMTPDNGSEASADGGTHVEHWAPLADDALLGRRDECPEAHAKGVTCTVDGCDGKGEIRRKRTCAEWIASEGKGHFASVNY